MLEITEKEVRKEITSGKYDKQLIKINAEVDKIIKKHQDIPREKVMEIIKEYDDLVFQMLGGA